VITGRRGGFQTRPYTKGLSGYQVRGLYIPRLAEHALKRALARSPAAVIPGPRQCGKSTLARRWIGDSDAVYLDLQDLSSPRDRGGRRLVMERGQRRLLFEIKLSKAPQPSRGFYELIDDLRPESATVVAPVDGPYEQRRGVWAMGLSDALARWGEGAASG
jgi:hypothetical protein